MLRLGPRGTICGTGKTTNDLFGGRRWTAAALLDNRRRVVTGGSSGVDDTQRIRALGAGLPATRAEVGRALAASSS